MIIIIIIMIIIIVIIIIPRLLVARESVERDENTLTISRCSRDKGEAFRNIHRVKMKRTEVKE